MKRMMFMLAMTILFVSCASTQFKFEDSGKIGVQVTIDEENSAFCVFDANVSKEALNTETTCSFTAKKGNKIFACDKIKLSNFGKSFKLETDCTMILDLSPAPPE